MNLFGSRFEESFVEGRRIALEQFLNRVVRHPDLVSSTYVKVPPHTSPHSHPPRLPHSRSGASAPPSPACLLPARAARQTFLEGSEDEMRLPESKKPSFFSGPRRPPRRPSRCGRACGCVWCGLRWNRCLPSPEDGHRLIAGTITLRGRGCYQQALGRARHGTGYA